jgi:CBS domain-containing protein
MVPVRIADIMSSPVVCVDRHTSLPEAHLLMKDYGIRRLPVLDDGQLVGILTLGDVRGASPSEVTPLNRLELSYLAEQIKVERVMKPEVVTVTEDTSLTEAAHLMLDNKISGLPVLSDTGQVVGMVTESDLFLALVELAERVERDRAPLDPEPASPALL